MTDSIVPRWLEWARRIQALSQSGLAFSQNEFDRDRYHKLAEIAAEISASYSNLEAHDLLQVFDTQIGYATPRVDVRAAVFLDGKLLMVRERMDGGWTMPGGWADVGDIPSEAAERETVEEAGFKVKARKLVGVYDANRIAPLEFFHAFKLVFLCDLIGGIASASIETSEVDFFGPQEIPANLSGARTTPRHIQDVFAALADPARPAVFD